MCITMKLNEGIARNVESCPIGYMYAPMLCYVYGRVPVELIAGEAVPVRATNLVKQLGR